MIDSKTDAGAVSHDGRFNNFVNGGTIYVQALIDKVNVSVKEQTRYDNAITKIKNRYELMGIRLTAVLKYSTDVLSKKQFQTTDGRSAKDSYVLVGNIDQLVKAQDLAMEGGWATPHLLGTNLLVYTV